MTAVERNPRRFLTTLFYIFLVLILAVALYFFIAQQFFEPAPAVPSDIVYQSQTGFCCCKKRRSNKPRACRDFS